MPRHRHRQVGHPARSRRRTSPPVGEPPGGEAVLTLNSVDHPLQIVADNVTVNGFEVTGFFYGPEIQFAAVNNAQRSNVIARL